MYTLIILLVGYVILKGIFSGETTTMRSPNAAKEEKNYCCPIKLPSPI